MKHPSHPVVAAMLLVASVAAPAALAQGPDAQPPRREPPARVGPGGFGPGGFGPMMREDIQLLDTHDQNDDGWLNADERQAAKADLAQRRAEQGTTGPGRRGPGGGQRSGPRGQNREPATPGPRVDPRDVAIYPDAPLYDDSVLRTIFLNFESDDWEAELQDFYGTDVEVPASMIVDGVTYPNVGVGFRGASSYFMIPAGYKRSFNVSLDMADDDQRLDGYRTLNLLNCNGDASMMSAVLFSALASEHLPVPKANFVRVVVNGEYWGLYANVQQFDRVFTEQHFGSSRGTRWKVPGSPGGDGGLGYLGEDLEPYESRYDMKSSDGRAAWLALINLCRVLNQTPPDRLVEELEPVLDIDGALWFLAYDVVFANSDGYWTRASDYSMFCDADGRFHLIPHDMNEAFQVGAHGPGFGGPGGFAPPPDGAAPLPGGPAGGRNRGPRAGPGGGGVTLDPLVGMDDDRMALRSRLLAVPELRERYLAHVREIAEVDLDWDRLGPRIERYRNLLESSVADQTRGLSSHDAFMRATAADASDADAGSLRDFAQRRRAFLLGEEPASNARTGGNAPNR